MFLHSEFLPVVTGTLFELFVATFRSDDMEPCFGNFIAMKRFDCDDIVDNARVLLVEYNSCFSGRKMFAFVVAWQRRVAQPVNEVVSNGVSTPDAPI